MSRIVNGITKYVVQFSSVQDGTDALGKTHMRSEVRLSEVSPTLPLKRSQCQNSMLPMDQRLLITQIALWVDSVQTGEDLTVA